MKNLNGFKKYTTTPNTISENGNLFIKRIYLNKLQFDKNRTIRVYLPSTYDFNDENKRFPVLYMMDGKNLFDDYTSFVGERGIDEVIEQRIKECKKEFIVVGIDAPKNGDERMHEMAFNGKFYDNTYKEDTSCYGTLLGEEIIDIIKPLIDKTFFTLTDKENTAIGGSSMGGLFSFYMGIKYKNIFSFVLSFSPGFLIYDFKYFKSEIKNKILDTSNFPNFYFFVGGKYFESSFFKSTLFTFKYLKQKQNDNFKVKLLFDSDASHNEKSWNKYLNDAISYWLD